MGNDGASLAVRPSPDLAMQAHERAIRVEERVRATEQAQAELRKDHSDLRREMTDMYLSLREKIDKVITGVYALLWCAAGTIIVMLVGAVAYMAWESFKAGHA